MQIVVGVNDTESSSDALALGLALARTLNAQLVVTNIYPSAFDYVGPGHVDAEWRKFLLDQANAALERARDEVSRDSDEVSIEFVLHPHKSSGIGLIEVAKSHGAQIIVIGSAPGGSEGRISGGSTSDQLLHASPVPVALAPLGYRGWAPPAIIHANVAYQATPESAHCLAMVARALVASGGDIPNRLRLVTIIERVTRIYGSRLGRHAEDQVLIALREQVEAALADAVSSLEVGAVTPKPGAGEPTEGLIETIVLEGESVTTALRRRDWDDTDILVVGSTGVGPVRRVFLGDMAYKLIRSTTIPIMIVPRSSASV